MHIELRKLKVVDALSEETTCYSAEIWIDGQRAFLASNRGHGAADDYHAVGTVTEQAVDAWLAANRPVSRLGDSVMPHCLEFEVAALITRIEEAKRLRRQCRTKLVTIEGDQVFCYRLKGRTPAIVFAGVQRLTPSARMVNGDDAALDEAVAVMIAQAGKHAPS